VVREQAAAGIDVPSDGEFGKGISWSQYALERLSGFERRAGARDRAASSAGADRSRFAEFYAELDAASGPPAMPARPAGEAVCVAPIRYTGQAEVQRDIDNFKAALKAAGVQEGFLPVAAPASVIPDKKNEHYKNDEEMLEAIADAMRVEYRAIVDAGLLLQLDDARRRGHLRSHGAAGELRRLPRLAGQTGRGHQSRHRGHSDRSHPLSRLLGQLARPAHHRRAAQGHRRPRAARARRRLPDRGREPAPRARVARLGEREAAEGSVLVPA
jgi:hypothetical protein